MPDDQKIDQAAGQETDTGEKQPEVVVEKTSQEGIEDKGDKGQDKTNAAKAQEDTSQLGTDDNAEPTVAKRMSPKDFIIQRQQKKIEALKDKVGEEETEGDDEEVNPEDESLISRVVAKQLKPILDQSIQSQDAKEVNEFIKTNPEFAPYANKALRFMAHPSRRQLPVETVFLEVVGRAGLMKIGAAKEKEAAGKSNNSQTGGGSPRGGDVKSDIWSLPKDEFEKQQEEVRRGQSASK
jgi:hypothetical protein